MRAGQLRQRGTIEARHETDDPEEPGAKLVHHAPVATVWYADITGTPSARFVVQAQKATTERSRLIEMRFRNDVRPGMRFVTDNAVLAIVAAIDPDTRAQRLVIVCEESEVARA